MHFLETLRYSGREPRLSTLKRVKVQYVAKRRISPPKTDCIRTRFHVSVLRDVTWYNGFAREVPRPAPIRTGVKAGQYKRTFTGSLHFYELDAATTPLQPSTECRKPSTSSVSLFVSSLFLPVTRTVNSYPIPSLFLPSYLLPTPRHRLSRLFLLASTLYQSTWHLCVTSGL